MKQKNTPLNSIFLVEPEPGLSKAILLRLADEQIQATRKKLVMFVFGTVAALGLFIVSLKYIIEQFSQSEVFHYLSLIYTDTASLSVYWKSLSYAIFESLPFVSITVFLISVTLLIVTLQKTWQKVQVARGIGALVY